MNWQRNKALNPKYIYGRYTVQVFFVDNYFRSLEGLSVNLYLFNLSQEREKKTVIRVLLTIVVEKFMFVTYIVMLKKGVSQAIYRNQLTSRTHVLYVVVNG
jgi:hypothetical protein